MLNQQYGKFSQYSSLKPIYERVKEYEAEKKKLDIKGLGSPDYEQKIKELAKRLRI